MRDVSVLMPKPADDDSIDKLCNVLVEPNSVAKTLQGGNTTIYYVRALIDAVIEEHPEIVCSLGPDENIVRHVCFECALIKVQENRVAELTYE